MSKKFLSKVIEDEGQTVLLFPEELLKTLALKANEILQWEIEGDTIKIKRLKFIDKQSASS